VRKAGKALKTGVFDCWRYTAEVRTTATRQWLVNAVCVTVLVSTALSAVDAAPATTSGRGAQHKKKANKKAAAAPKSEPMSDAVPTGSTADNATSGQHLGAAFRAYDAGDLAAASKEIALVVDKNLINRDYALWLRGQLALVAENGGEARRHFTALATVARSRFAAVVLWRLADADWISGNYTSAADAYEKLLAAKNADQRADLATVLYRVAQAHHGVAQNPKAELNAQARRWYRRVMIEYPSHPLADDAMSILVSNHASEATLSPLDRIERAKHMTDAHQWDAAVAEIERLDTTTLSKSEKVQRDYWLGTTLYKMRRRYDEAGDLLINVSASMSGGSAAEAKFHGARALSRADRDDDAITWYQRVVAEFPSTDWAKEAQFLTGWLEFNRGNYKAAISPLETMLVKYPTSKWMDDALWFLGMSHYMLGDFAAAKENLVALSKHGGALEGGKGQYWLARTEERLRNSAAALDGYRATVKRYPFSWYAMLARARLKAAGAEVGPFGVASPSPRGPTINSKLDADVERDPLIARADELIAAGMLEEAGYELARDESGFLKRHDRAAAFAVLFDRFQRATNFNRPWMLSIVHAASALDGPPTGAAKIWWQNAYPRAYQTLIEKHQALGDNPDGYLYSIMRKESGFNPHDISYADAQGLLQMIPPTTKRVCDTIKLTYDDGRLYEPEFNIQTGSWYIGHMLTKFKKQIPIGAGSFNSGPRPVMKWLDQNGDREIDEFVELVPYIQTREYMKKVTENYARYRYLYAGEDYQQPLAVDKAYVKNNINY
jgi:soluble lytic murein transglycosylase